MTIDQLWVDLESDTTFSAGLYYRRPAAAMLPNLYVGLKLPTRHRCIAIETSPEICDKFAQYNTLRDIQFEPYIDSTGKYFLLILLANPKQTELFTVLCEDLIRAVQSLTSTEDVISNLIARIQKWQTLFDKLKSQGLQELSQIGLYGELYFLRRIVRLSDKPQPLVRCWVGPQNANQDFSFINCAVEVKTTHGKNHQKIHIANERQLDTSTIPRLFLYHLSVDVRANSGETLNDCVDDLCSILSSDPLALSILRLQLSTMGYFDIHREVYSKTGYSVRRERAFKVEGDFPRIVEASVPGGVGDIQYTIVIPDDTVWSLPLEEMITIIKA
jgi:hypothetical protein